MRSREVASWKEEAIEIELQMHVYKTQGYFKLITNESNDRVIFIRTHPFIIYRILEFSVTTYKFDCLTKLTI